MPVGRLRTIGLSALSAASLFAVLLLVAWGLMVRMPGSNVAGGATLTPAEITLRSELAADVQKLAGDIGERNLPRYPALNAAADFIEKSFREIGLQPRRDTYEVNGRACHNIEVEIPGATPDIVLVGAHYDSVFGAPGANDNGTGAAAVMALARRFAGKRPQHTIRFVEFTNEEPPYFQTRNMGSLVYAGRCKTRGDRIDAMISLETIGYFSDAPRSQIYPSAAFGLFYPTTGNFIGFVSNIGSRGLLKQAIKTFRQQARIPSQGAAVPASIPGVGWSDHWSFWQNGYRAIMVTDTAPFRYPHYHAPSDTPDKLDYDRFTLVVSGIERVIANLAGPSS